MNLKEKRYSVSVLGNKEVRQEKDVKFYTTDNNAWLVFKLADLQINSETATITLINLDDKSVVSELVKAEDNAIKYHMRPEIIEHAGNWQVQLIFDEENNDYTSAVISLKVHGHLMDNKEPSLKIIDNWNTFMRQAEDFMIDIDDQLHELPTYARRINDLEKVNKNFDTELTQTNHDVLNINKRVQSISIEEFNDLVIDNGGPNEDWSPAINLAIDTMSKYGGKIVLPSGSFYIRNSIILKPNIILEGQGMSYREIGGTILRVKGNINGLYTGYELGDEGDIRNVHLKNFLIVGDSEATEGVGLYGANLRYNCSLESVGFKKFALDGIRLFDSWKIRFTDVLSNLNRGCGVSVQDGANDISFYDCEFNRNEKSGLKVEISVRNKNHKVILINCLIENNKANGATINDIQSITFISNYFEGNRGYGIYLRGESGGEIWNANVIGNRFYGHSDNDYALAGLYIRKDTRNYFVSGNYFSNFINENIRLERGKHVNGFVAPNHFSASSGETVLIEGVGIEPMLMKQGNLSTVTTSKINTTTKKDVTETSEVYPQGITVTSVTDDEKYPYRDGTLTTYKMSAQRTYQTYVSTVGDMYYRLYHNNFKGWSEWFELNKVSG